MYVSVSVFIHGGYATLTESTTKCGNIYTYEKRTASSAFSCLKYVLCTITYQLLAAGICSCHARYVQRNLFCHRMPSSCYDICIRSSKVDFTM